MKVLASPTANDRRQDTITHIFEQCCRDGLLSSRFVRTLSNGPFHDDGWTEKESKRVCKELFGDHPSFPSAWSRNLKDKKAQPTMDCEMKSDNHTGSVANKEKTDVTIEKKGGVGFSGLFHRKKDKSPT